MRRGKKSVVRVAQRVAALVAVQGLPSFFSNMWRVAPFSNSNTPLVPPVGLRILYDWQLSGLWRGK